jgi:hypothetical protein
MQINFNTKPKLLNKFVIDMNNSLIRLQKNTTRYLVTCEHVL